MKAILLLTLLAFLPVSSACAVDPLPPPFQATLNENTAGVGIALSIVEGELFVAKVMPDSPAAASQQIHEGDRVLAMGEGEQPSVPLAGKSIEDCVLLIRGAAGSRVRLTVVPKDSAENQAREVMLTRDELQNPLGLALDATLLKPKTQAPELRYVPVSGGKVASLSTAYRGKVVVLEFWATWCAPCQRSVTQLQMLAAKYADQKDKVAFLTISIDGDMDGVGDGGEKALKVYEKVHAHVKRAGWTQTANGWTTIEGRKDWHIGAVPTTYVIGADGKIIAANPTPEKLVELLAALPLPKP